MTTTSPIYTTEPMATRALAAEIRHDHVGFMQLLASHADGASFGTLTDVRCETDKRLDVVLEFTDDDKVRRVGIEAKFDHELTRKQIEKELSNVDTLFVLVSSREAVPSWLATDYPGVSVVTWGETLATFHESRLTMQDVLSIRGSAAGHLELTAQRSPVGQLRGVNQNRRVSVPVAFNVHPPSGKGLAQI